MAAIIPAVTKISSKIIRVLGCNPGPMTLQGTNTYIVGTGKRRVLIDTGDVDVPQYIHHLKSVLEEEEILLDHILISHWHHDHIYGLPDIFNQLTERVGNCKVWKFPSKNAKTSDIPDSLSLQTFLDKQEFKVEGATLKVLYTPGHTDDHAIFHLLEDNAIFSGDCILGEGTAVFENLYDYMNSLKLIAELHPSIIYPGHGNIVKDPKERISYYIQHRMERENQIIDVLSNNPSKTFTEDEIVKAIYKDLSSKLVAAASKNVNHHLTKLLMEEKVHKTNDQWQIKL